ncbi:hypothetical protein BOTBODRAFT_53824 [Botryobasidium botryosum FD-172 SS1]|uniref:Peptidase S8/S53 domain-containing protein n=1 Tax=Botryobasidium botryosum (strain FD-172 SS1) TaxID=930990 RepID=A0A067MMF9_BOTB1|nr:hypothetical protein BOTBODRAFT_53824 [Botryobasidium botryosum FD-172 SS1]
MRSFAAAAAASLLALVLPVLSSPLKVPIPAANGPVEKDSYIVTLKPGVDKTAHLAALASVLASTDSHIAYNYTTVLDGYAGTIKGAALDFVQSSKDVAHIEYDHIVQLSFKEPTNEEATAEAAAVEPLANGGAGVTLYGIDTGIYTAHQAFGGRARWGATFGGYKDADGNGHGTHTAATAVGARYGRATSANIIAVKVLSDSGSGKNSDIIAGVNYAVNAALKTRRPSIITMSLGGPAGPNSQALDKAVADGIAKGVHFTIAAGNDNKDSSTFSPADVAPANTIGAVDSKNVKASFSNHGPGIDVWAPGVNILSAWIGSPSASRSISGTSMATPYVAGILAVALGESKAKLSPAQLTSQLKAHAKPVVTGIGNTGSTNLLATAW